MLFAITITGLPAGLSAHPLIVAVEVLLLAYFVVVNVIDFALITTSGRHLGRFLKLGSSDSPEKVTLPYAMPVSIIVPAYNESENIESVVRSLLAVRYPAEHEIIVINDGSTDDTLERLTRLFSLAEAGGAEYRGFETKPIRAVYQSTTHAHLRVIDKENGGKADALNAGLDLALYPLILAGDGDSIYAPDVLEQMIAPFLEDPATVGCGAALRVLNDADIVDGVPQTRRLPRKYLVRFQVLEYLRAGLNSRFGWGPLNGMTCVSGACALWRKDVLRAVGGYSTNTIWEDMEMTVRVHHYMRSRHQRYRIAFVPNGVCWTHVPETIADLRRQRMSWQRHITEAVTMHRNLLFSREGGIVGWFALPAIILTELFAPIWLMLGICFVVATSVMGILSVEAQLALLAFVFSLTLLKVAFSFVLDERSYRTHSPRQIWALFWAALWEQIGYRQLIALWSLAGTIQFYVRSPIRGKRENVPSLTDRPYQPPKATR